jgi:hypothetical protein
LTLILYHTLWDSAENGALQTQAAQQTDQLARIAFLTESSRTLKDIDLTVQLDREYKPEQLGQFRISIQIIDRRYRGPGLSPVLWLGCRDNYAWAGTEESPHRTFGVLSFFASRNPDRNLDVTVQLDDSVTSTSLVQARFALPEQTPFKTLADLNYKIPTIFISESLVGKIEELTLTANNYVIIKTKADTFNSNVAGPIEGWPPNEVQGFRDQDQPLIWRAVVLGPPNGPWEAPHAWTFDFEESVPVKNRS